MTTLPLHRSWPLFCAALLGVVAALLLVRKACESPSWAAWTAAAACMAALAFAAWMLAWRGRGTPWISALALRVRAFFIVASILLCVPEIIALKSGVDWDERFGNEVTPRQMAPFFRAPSVRIESVFFRKQGPLHWEGRPLTLMMEHSLAADVTYVGERVIAVDHDADGFRNAPPLTDWDIAVVGDSYTELGFLPQEELFTSVLARRTGRRVRNLGASSSGPFSYLSFFNHHAKSPSCRHAMFVLFEGNDVTDAEKEWTALETFERTGVAPDRAYHPQASLLTAAWKSAPRLMHPPARRTYANAWLRIGDGEVAVTMSDAWLPPDPTRLTVRQQECIERALSEMKQSATAAGMKPWLVFLPACNRLYAGRLRFTDATPPAARKWERNTLPEFIASLCAKHGLALIDATAPLQAAIDAGRMVYNPVRDFHLNAEGSRVVGEAMAVGVKNDE